MKKIRNLFIVLSVFLMIVGCQQLNTAPIITELKTVKDIVEPGEQIQIEVKAVDKEDTSLTVAWSVTGGEIIGTGKAIEWKAPSEEGTYTITVKVSDGKNDVSKSIQINVRTSNQAPAITSLTSEKAIVQTSEKVSIQIVATDPDNDPLTYRWEVTGGTITGEGDEVVWTAADTSGEFTISATVSDGALEDTASVTIKVLVAPEVEEVLPQVSYVGEVIEIAVNANDPNGEELCYQWEDMDGNILGNSNSLEWQTPATFGVYYLTVKISNQLYEIKQTITINVEDDSHFVPKLVNVYFLIADDIIAEGSLATEQGYLIALRIDDPNRDLSAVAMQAEIGDVELTNEGFIWNAPSEPGEYTLTFTMQDSVYTAVEKYKVTVVANSRPVINDISVNGEIIENNIIQVEPGVALDIIINGSDNDNDDILYYVWGYCVGYTETANFSVNAPIEEGMYDIGVILFDGIQIELTRFTLYVNNGIDDSISDQNVIDQVNIILDKFIVDFSERDIDSILSYTHPDFRDAVEMELEDYYYWYSSFDSVISMKTEIVPGITPDTYEIIIALKGEVSYPWDEHKYQRSDSIRIEFQDDGSGVILLKSVSDFF